MSENKRSFYLIVISQGIALIGGAAIRFAISLYVLDLTGSAEIFATMVAVSFLPMIFFQPIGGVLADRFSKKMILVISDSVNALLAGILAVMLFSGNRSVFLFGAVITLLTLVSTCYHPTVTSSLPAILKEEELAKANGVVQSLKAISTIAGPVLAGLLFGIIGANNLIGLCAIVFMSSVVLNLFIKIPYSPQKIEGGIINTILLDLKGGFVYITKENPLLFRLALLFSGLILFYQAMLSVAFPFMIRIAFAMSEEFLGFANAGIGISILFGSFAAGKLRIQVSRIPYYIIAMAAAAVPVAISAMLPRENSIIPFMVLTSGFMLIMFIFTLLNISVMTHVQTHVPKQMVGKSVGIIVGITNFTAPVGQFALGRLIECLANMQFVIYLAIALITFILGMLAKKWLRAESYNPPAKI